MKIYLILLSLTFTLATYAQAPENDQIANAIPLVLGESFLQNKIFGTNENATDSTNETTTPIPDPVCNSYLGGDVWYTATVGSTGQIAVGAQLDFSFQFASITPQFAIYSGTVDALTLEACGNNVLLLFSRTVGEELFIRVWDSGNNNFGVFEVAAFNFTVPNNDLLTNATSLIVGTSFEDSKIDGSNLGASDSTNEPINPIPAPSCSSFIGGDVWYTAIVGASGNIAFESEVEDYTRINLNLTIYAGPEDALTEISCNNELVTISDRTPGEQVWVRVWDENNDALGPIEIAAYDFVAPENDALSNATTLIVGSSSDEYIVVGNNFGATDSVNESTNPIPAPNCGSYEGGDLWYSATVGASGNIAFERNGDFTDPSTIFPYIAVYSGTVDDLILEACNFELIALTDRTVGEQLFLRAFEYANNDFGSFEISAFDFETPENDAIVNAIPLTVGSSFEEYKIQGSNFAATDSTNEPSMSIPSPGCGNYNGGDVWYTVVVGTSGNIVVEGDNISGSSTTSISPYIALYSGTADALVLEACGSEFASLSGRSSGEQLFVRVWERFNDNFGIFEISAYDFETPPNDMVVNAISLTVGATFEDNVIIGNNLGATDSTNEGVNPIPDPGCNNYNGGDLWYTAIVGSTGNIAIEERRNNFVSPSISSSIALYSGTTDTMILEACGDDIVALSGRTVGEQLFIRVWDRFNDNSGEFELSAYSFSVPDNDLITNATNLTVGSDFENSKIIETNLGATDSTDDVSPSIPVPTCDDYLGGDVWYTASIGASGNIVFHTDRGGDSPIGVSFVVYSGTSDALIVEACGTDQISFSGRTPGEQLYLRVWEDGNDPGTFEIAAYDFETPSNDSVFDAITLVIGEDFNESKVSGNNFLTTDSINETTNPIPAPECASYEGGDVWYKLVVEYDTDLTIKTANIMDTGLAIYSGDVNNLSLVDCNDDDDDDDVYDVSSKINLVNPSVGQELYIRVYGYDGESGQFELSAFDGVGETLGTEDVSSEPISHYVNQHQQLVINSSETIEKVLIYNLLGQHELTFSENTNNTFNISNLATGIYIVKVKDDNRVSTFKIVK